MITNLMDELLKEGHSFSFFQILRLLRFYISKSSGKSESDLFTGDVLRIHPALSLAFPASDVESIQNTGDVDNPKFLILANILGLYGSSSPLPIFYTEDLIDEANEDESTTRDFINIINQRLFSLLFESWSKYRLYLKVVEEEDPSHINRLFCLLGLGGESIRRDIAEPYRLLRYLGLLTQFPRSARGLETLLTDAFGIQVAVIPCIQRTVQVPEDQRLRLGGEEGSSLGMDSYLGDHMEDRMGKFRIQVGPLFGDDYKRFSPGTDAFERLIFLTKFYFVEPLEYDIELIMAEGAAQTICLGDPTRSTLGMDTWIFSSRELGEVRVIFHPKKDKTQGPWHKAHGF
ncbi:MAG: type VI secretion system baseplate subunit TssG [Deltaproteobacteria bacterium]|nr:type VI secretion system baseplate subunit TssG [Deltaproteobacteria bacterium]